MFVYCRVTTQDARGDEKLAEKLQDLAGVVTRAATGRQPDFSPHGDAALLSGQSPAAAERRLSLTISHSREMCVLNQYLIMLNPVKTEAVLKFACSELPARSVELRCPRGAPFGSPEPDLDGEL